VLRRAHRQNAPTSSYQWVDPQRLSPGRFPLETRAPSIEAVGLPSRELVRGPAQPRVQADRPEHPRDSERLRFCPTPPRPDDWRRPAYPDGSTEDRWDGGGIFTLQGLP